MTFPKRERNARRAFLSRQLLEQIPSSRKETRYYTASSPDGAVRYTLVLDWSTFHQQSIRIWIFQRRYWYLVAIDCKKNFRRIQTPLVAQAISLHVRVLEHIGIALDAELGEESNVPCIGLKFGPSLLFSNKTSLVFSRTNNLRHIVQGTQLCAKLSKQEACLVQYLHSAITMTVTPFCEESLPYLRISSVTLGRARWCYGGRGCG